MKTIEDIVGQLTIEEVRHRQIRRRGIWQGKETLPKDGTVFVVPAQFGYDRCFYDSGYWWYYRSDIEDEGSYAAGPEPEMWWPI